MFGRSQVFTDVENITDENVCSVLSEVLPLHMKNRMEIDYLYNYFCGKTPILGKTKEIRPTINHKINENRAYQIVEFKNSTCFGEPVQYISRGNNTNHVEEVNKLNEYMIETEKEAEDRDIGLWMHIAGVGYRMVLPDVGADVPFKHCALDPRDNFIVKSNAIGNKPMMCVTMVMDENMNPTYSVYTASKYYEIKGSNILKSSAHLLGDIPMIEYPLNFARLGAFEVALPLLDAINELESNRLDDVQQYVNSFLALLGGSMTDNTYKMLEENKLLCLPEGVDAKYLSVALQQGDMQTLKDNLYQSVLTVCGMPSQAAESASTSDTGIAVLYRGGWSQAEARAKATEIEFKRSEKKFLQLVLRMVADTVGTPLKVKDIEIKFTRRFVDDILTKTQALSQLLSAGINPEVAIYTCGLWNDPTDVYLKSKSYLEQWEVNADEAEEDVPVSGRDYEATGYSDAEAVREEP